MKYIDSEFRNKENRVHYLTNSINSDTLIVVFPPGILDARFIYDLDLPDSITNKVKIISITYPSRYKSSRLKEADSPLRISKILAEILIKYISTKPFKKVVIAGFSFGTMISTVLLQNYSDQLSKLGVELNVVLVNPGEFFEPYINRVLRKMFLPALEDKQYAKGIKMMLTKYLHAFEKKFFPDSRLFDINEQWIGTLDYRINTRLGIDIPTSLIVGGRDMIIASRSMNKLERVFKNRKVKMYKGNHLIGYRESADYAVAKTLLIDSFESINL